MKRRTTSPSSLVRGGIFRALCVVMGLAASPRVAAGGSSSMGAPLACPDGMVAIGEDSCIDRWEDFVVEVDPGGGEHPHSPYEPVDGLTVRAKTAPGVVPQGYISQVQAQQACESAGKRLCYGAEFMRACRGDDENDAYPYGGTTRVPGRCNEGKGSMIAALRGADASRWTYADLNAPELNRAVGGLAPTGSYSLCVSPYGVFDMVGNLHEWGAEPPDAKGNARLRGGFYGDAENNGPGCSYVTTAHRPTYHDYSTGFRCCLSPTSERAARATVPP